MSKSSIWPIDRILSGVTTGIIVDIGAMAMKWFSAFSKTAALLGPHHWMKSKGAVDVFYPP